MVQKGGLDEVLIALQRGNVSNDRIMDSHGNVHDSKGALIGKFDISRERPELLKEVNEFGLDSSGGIYQNYMKIEFERKQLKLFPDYN